jgi:enterochelin esterase-like enzyme
MSVAVAAALLVGLSSSAFAQGEDEPLVSPELTCGGDVILRLRAPAAESVRVMSGGDIPGLSPREGLPLIKGGDGVWSISFPSMRPGSFRYRFSVDGVATLDPSNPLTSQSNRSSWSLFHVPGYEFMDTQPVEHGAVAEVTYYSSTLSQHRRMHVYTPPGYQGGRRRYPVFYLIHGGGDSDDSWSTIGRAGFILDNLIAEGKAEPMIVVMPDGHTPSATRELNASQFANEFVTDIKPYVEAIYRVQTGPRSTAVAGLSMGGGHTLEILASDMPSYGYAGVFSSGVFGINEGSDWVEQHMAVLSDAELREDLEYFWFAVGTEDFVYDTTLATVAMLREHGFDVDYHESGGGHTWENWRVYLNDFAQAIFH